VSLGEGTGEPDREDFEALRWESAWIDPAVRRLAEAAAENAGLSIDAWVERAVRHACDLPPAAQFRSEAAAPQTPRNFSSLANGALAPAARYEREPVRLPPTHRGLQILPPAMPRASMPPPAPLSYPVQLQEPSRGRIVNLVWAASASAVIAIVAVAVLRDPSLMGRPVPATSVAANLAVLPPPSDLDRPSLRSLTAAQSTESAPGEPGAHAAAARGDGSTLPVATVAIAPHLVAAMPAAPRPQAAPGPLKVAAATPQATIAEPIEIPPPPSVTAGAPPEPVAAPKPAPMKAGMPKADSAEAMSAPPPKAEATPAAPAAAPAPKETVATAEAPPPSAPPSQTMVPTEPSAAEEVEAAKVVASLEPKVKAGDHLAEYRLGILYALGKGVPRDYDRAAGLLRQAAQSGLPEAQYDYAVLCDKGLGVTRDPAEAAHWYAKAAQKGHPPAALNLGYAYAEGIGVQRNLPEAAKWFRRAAEAGLVNAQFNLAYMYEQGAGIGKSLVEAYGWYNAAAESGDRGARDALDRIGGTMSAKERAEAKNRAKAIERSIKPPG
jgi:localization factor PodJL